MVLWQVVTLALKGYQALAAENAASLLWVCAGVRLADVSKWGEMMDSKFTIKARQLVLMSTREV